MSNFVPRRWCFVICTRHFSWGRPRFNIVLFKLRALQIGWIRAVMVANYVIPALIKVEGRRVIATVDIYDTT